MALLPVDRTKPLLHRRRAWLSAISERDENVIPFVSLYVLQILHEYGLALLLYLLAITVDELVVGTEAPQLFLDEIALVGVHSHQTESGNGFLVHCSEVSHELNRFFCDAAGFGAVPASLICALDADKIDRE